MRPRPPRRKPEPTIALINVVFLMLVFFMVAGTLAAPVDADLKLVDTRDLEGRDPANALVITRTGGLRFRGQSIAQPDAYLAHLEGADTARILPDRDAPARVLLEVSRRIRAAGFDKVLIVTEKALQ